jgi:hypothetical protein
MLWKLFGSEQKVQEALEQSIGYDISPAVIKMPANDAAPKAVDKEAPKPEFYFMAPWDSKQA